MFNILNEFCHLNSFTVKTMPAEQHLELLFGFCNVPPFLSESLETLPPWGDNVISYIVLFSLHSTKID